MVTITSPLSRRQQMLDDIMKVMESYTQKIGLVLLAVLVSALATSCTAREEPSLVSLEEPREELRVSRRAWEKIVLVGEGCNTFYIATGEDTTSVLVRKFDGIRGKENEGRRIALPEGDHIVLEREVFKQIEAAHPGLSWGGQFSGDGIDELHHHDGDQVITLPPYVALVILEVQSCLK